jgi:DNA primase
MNAIKKLDARRLIESISPFDFYGYEKPGAMLTRPGWNDGGLCPFHDDGHKGSFRINATSGAFKCFSCGAAGGDVAAFLMQRDGLTFTQALSRLADEWGY